MYKNLIHFVYERYIITIYFFNLLVNQHKNSVSYQNMRQHLSDKKELMLSLPQHLHIFYSKPRKKLICFTYILFSTKLFKNLIDVQFKF